MIRRLSVCLFAAALAAGCTLPVETFRAAAYGEIARVQMAGGDAAGARSTAQRAVEAVAAVDTEEERVFGIPAAAIAQVRAGDLDGADATVELADKEQARVLAYAALAVALKDSGYPARARAAATRAVEIALGSADAHDREEMIVYAAWTQAAVGETRAALANADTLGRQSKRYGLLALVAETQLEAGDIAGARATVEAIGDGTEKVDDEAWLFSRIILGMAVDSIAAFEDIMLHSAMPVKSILLTRIAIAQARAGNAGGARQSFTAALDAAGGAGSTRAQVRSLGAVALGRAQTDDVAGAVQMLDDAELRIAAETAGEEEEDDRDVPVFLQVVRSAIEGRAVAGDLAQRTSDADNEDFVLGAMAHIQLGNARQAEEDLTAAAAAISGNDLSLVAAAYASLAEMRLSRRDRAGARRAAGRSLAIADRIAETTEDKVIGLYFAAVALARSGNVVLALETAARMQKPARN